MDVVDKIIALEQGELNAKDTVELFAHLVNTGLAWQLQGSYGRMAQRFIDRGLIVKNATGEWEVNHVALDEALAG